MNKYRFALLITVVAVCLADSGSAFAQQMERGQKEATATVGVVAGIRTHATFAGSAGAAVNERIFAYGEFGYIPLGGSSVSVNQPSGGFEFSSGGRFFSFMGGAQYQFRQIREFVPFAAGALGLVHSSGNVRSTVGSTTTETSFSTDDFYVSFGGGARYYVNERWGFKPEFMIFAGEDSFYRFAAGVFYQF